MSSSIARLRTLLGAAPSWAAWVEIIAILDRFPAGERELHTDYVRGHLDGVWPARFRCGHGGWSEDSVGWSLVEGESREIDSLPHAIEVWCPPGTFRMGACEGDEEAQDFESPSTEVTLTQPFWAMATPVTRRMWESIFEECPATFSIPDAPLDSATWFDAIAFCNALSELEGLEPVYELESEEGTPGTSDYSCEIFETEMEREGYRLPTEAEWEFMARAGCQQPRYGELTDIAWCKEQAQGSVQKVATKAPNAWGLYDTLGNVYEWCFDTWVPSLPGGEWTDFVRDGEGLGRILRGGSWFNPGGNSRLSARNRAFAGMKSAVFGFRVVRTASDTD